MGHPAGYEPRQAWRDRLAHAICQFALQRIATRWYAAMIEGAIRYGLDAAARDAAEGNPVEWMPRVRGEHPH
jgi:hypothetical protein